MKKLSLTLLSFILTFSMFAGGIVTNTNHSAAWSRMMVRDASTDIDAAYFNPAGLTKLADGFHLSVSSQTITQTRNINNSMLNKDYEGTTFAPVFPNLYAAYKTGKLAFSFGFMGIGGGGTAEFAGGLPSFEMPVAGAATSLEAIGVTGYSMDMNLEGSSIYFGFQFGVSYEINDMISIYAGGRYVMANNKYIGYLKNIQFVTATSGTLRADDYMNVVAAQATAGATAATGGGDGMQPLIDGGAGTLTFAQAEGAGIIDAATRAQLEGGLLALGQDQATIDAMNIATAQGTYYGIATTLNTQAAGLTAGAAQMGDKELDADQTGSAFTPIFGVNISLMEEKLNIGIKYELQTNLELTNETTTDDVGMFPDGEKENADMPAMLSVGIGYQLTDALYATFGFHTYFDKNVGWKKTDPFTGSEMTADDFVDNGFMEYGFGLEYAINEQLLVSAGWLGTKTGVKDNYHGDLSYSLNTNTIGFGGAYRINDMINLNLGGYYTMYKDLTIQYTGYSQTYSKTNMGFALGLDFTFGGGGE